MKFLEALYTIRDEILNGKVRSVGICGWLDTLLPGGFDFEYHLVIRDWTLFSGNEVYPVPHPTLPPHVAYYECHNTMYDMNTEYGRNRMNLLEWLINYYEKENIND